MTSAHQFIFVASNKVYARKWIASVKRVKALHETMYKVNIVFYHIVVP